MFVQFKHERNTSHEYIKLLLISNRTKLYYARGNNSIV